MLILVEEVRTVVSVNKSEKSAQIMMQKKKTISPKTLFTLNVSDIHVVLERSPLVNSPCTLYLVLQMDVCKKH